MVTSAGLDLYVRAFGKELALSLRGVLDAVPPSISLYLSFGYVLFCVCVCVCECDLLANVFR